MAAGMRVGGIENEKWSSAMSDKFKLVPIKPTEEMIDAGCDLEPVTRWGSNGEILAARYGAMLNAAPTSSPISDQAAGDLEAEATNLEQIAKAGERVFSELVVATLRDTALRMREFCAERSTTGSTPEKLPAHEWGGDYPSNDSYQDGYVNGWNDCIDAAPTTGSAPVATLHDDGYYTFHGEKPHGFNYQGWRMDVYAAPASPAASVLTGWISAAERLPDVKAGTEREFIVACRRASNGKTYVFAASYLNQMGLMFDDDDCPEDGRPTTGWFNERNDPEYDNAFEKVCDEGDEVTHWMALPDAPALLAASMGGDRT